MGPGFVPFVFRFDLVCFFRYKCKGLEGDELQSDFYKNFVWYKVYLIEEYLWNSYWCNECGAVVDEGGVEAGWAFRPFGDWDKKIEVTFTKVDEQLKRAERVLPFLRPWSPNGRFRSSQKSSLHSEDWPNWRAFHRCNQLQGALDFRWFQLADRQQNYIYNCKRFSCN